ncbi:ABC transporter substrate-binding protein [Alicyclobacillus sp. ALC3]|uniref:ABC transporter substrate-binding protein n=1 Tax=Alicyclobacillus sp. ALC3 TaxID=2796143 RepID=UPI0023794C19|nr:sugar ABC transporter substrate-binding protein [Alicyclobacillus sp. ALC3]WDL98171.1 sugar ABC transporter substrate-binding protein [Alicyclobacillus sp. ALC3]
MKRWLGVTAVSLVGIGVLAGCGQSAGAGNTANNSTSSGGAQKSVSLTLGMWTSSPAEKQLVEKQVKAFESQNPNIHVNIQVINGNYQQQIQTMLASHTAPDIFYVDSSYAPQFESSGALMPLGKYISEGGVQTSAFSPALLKAFQWKGQQYGLPKDFNTLALYYNKTMFAKAGIASPPTTWAQFNTDAAKLKAKGMVPMVMAPTVARYYPWVLDDGGSYFNSQTNTATLTNSKNAAGLNFYLQDYKKGYITQPKSIGQQSGTDAFAAGKAAMNLTGAWSIPAIQQTAPNLKYGIADMPTLNGKSYNYTFTVSYSMSATTKHPNSAAKLLFFMTGDAALKMTAQSGLAIPSRTSEQSLVTQSFPQEQPFIDGVKNAVPFQFGTVGSTLVNAVDNELPAALNGSESASQMLAKAAKIVASQG